MVLVRVLLNKKDPTRESLRTDKTFTKATRSNTLVFGPVMSTKALKPKASTPNKAKALANSCAPNSEVYILLSWMGTLNSSNALIGEAIKGMAWVG